MAELTAFEIQLLQVLQQPLPICQRPFAELAFSLDTTEKQVIETARRLKSAGVIRRFRAALDYRALGRIASLIAAHVPNEKFTKVADAVNALDNVSHNYCRDHYYNLWFTMQASSLIAIDVMLTGLREDFDVDFHSLPATRLFKLDVRFNPAGPQSPMPQGVLLPDVPSVPVELTDMEKQVLNAVQTELPITECPFENIIRDKTKAWSGSDTIEILHSLTQKGVLRKISAVLNYPALGYTANAMFCAEVPQKKIGQVGGALAAGSMVSHCYERKTFPGWPFNLYAMCHAAALEHITEMTESFCIAHNLTNSQLLPTLAELKKQPVKIELF